MADLLPCPFCGGVGKAVQPSTLDGWTVHCTKCDTEGSEWIDEAAATRAWNRRIPAKTALDHFIDDVEAAESGRHLMAPTQPKYPDDSLIAKMVNEARKSMQEAADAARYRHLVATCNVDFDPSEPWQLVIWEPSTGEDWKAKLDAAIDAAIQGDQP